MNDEIWKPIPGYEGWYSASDMGRIRRDAPGPRTRSGNIIQPCPGRYPGVVLSVNGRKRREPIHRLVASAFFGPIPGGHQVNHKNGVKTDSRLCNLEIVTASENQLHASRTGLRGKKWGESSHLSKLTTEQVREIRRLGAETKLLHREIAEMFGVGRREVDRILRGERWAGVQ